MRKLFTWILLIATIGFVGCVDITQELTINEDGSGTYSNTSDMGTVISILKNMGAADKLGEMGKKSIDSSRNISEIVDQIPGLTDAEKALASKGQLHIKLDVAKDAFATKLTFPFANVGEVEAINRVAQKSMEAVMKEKLKEQESSQGMPEMPEASSVDAYYKTEFSNGELTRKVIDSKFKGIASDEYFNGLKQAMGMGIEFKSTYIINLPRPAQKAEGKNVVLSADKKKVTVTSSIEDFLEDASVFEFKIKY